ncbi:MAG: SH3 domain-containing protein [Rhodospirillales bacterium]|nr:SH3 domain-containing protein [Rhodospirillales bacterium]MCW8860974.1 SH3 domain-containing protein [Rhodospirillales bacterium]MCW8953091.1 SH3 domain-containing protein [Rhodospirillales bacterium]MCW8971610.1 SH3 domain-containing protein [Rhodospirillales bacterium]MCW9003325.1 SH3 domain-containing protein [Rhodospirillales bacterium]
MRILFPSRRGFFATLLLLAFVLATFGEIAAALAQQRGSGLPLPRFVSLRSDEVNMRTGPSVRYPVEWVYKRQGLPMEVVAEFDTWRKVRDWRGSQGWVHQSMLSSARTVIITGKDRTLRARPDSRAAPMALLESGVVGELEECQKDDVWCRIQVNGYDGWIRRVEIWGVYSDEAIE